MGFFVDKSLVCLSPVSVNQFHFASLGKVENYDHDFSERLVARVRRHVDAAKIDRGNLRLGLQKLFKVDDTSCKRQSNTCRSGDRYGYRAELGTWYGYRLNSRSLSLSLPLSITYVVLFAMKYPTSCSTFLGRYQLCASPLFTSMNPRREVVIEHFA